jgi:putative membrane protein
MMYHGYGMGMGWSLLTFAFLLLALLLVVGLTIALIQRRSPEPPSGNPAPGAEGVLADRLARGEIGAEEYASRLRALRAERR